MSKAFRVLVIAVGVFLVFFSAAYLYSRLLSARKLSHNDSALDSNANSSLGPLGKALGGTFSLKDGGGNGYKISVQRYYASATPVGPYNTSNGSQVAAAYIIVTGTGPGKAKVTPLTDMSVLTSAKQSFSARQVSVAECTPQYPFANNYIAKGQTESGCITFQMPLGIRISSLTYTPSGTTNTVTWNL